MTTESEKMTTGMKPDFWPDPSAMPFGVPIGERTFVMGVLNITPDSFSDGGQWAATDAAVDHAHGMAAEGADIIDIGGESTRPNFESVPLDEEMARVMPVLERLALDGFAVPISIDTMKPAMAAAAVRAGARMINDIRGLQGEPDMARVVADCDTGLIAMYHRNEIDDEIDIIENMHHFFERTLEIAARAGIPDRRMMLDPGIGFGKSHQQNLVLIGHCQKLQQRFGLPVLLGTSRKSFIGRIVASEASARIPGSIASAVLGGTDMVRVHDVAETVQAMRVADAIRKAMICP